MATCDTLGFGTYEMRHTDGALLIRLVPHKPACDGSGYLYWYESYNGGKLYTRESSCYTQDEFERNIAGSNLWQEVPECIGTDG